MKGAGNVGTLIRKVRWLSIKVHIIAVRMDVIKIYPIRFGKEDKNDGNDGIDTKTSGVRVFFRDCNCG